MQGRFELKFVIDGETKARFLEAVRDGLWEDPHGTDAVYRVSSLYFDTPAYRAVQEKVDGESIRKKYRLRYYGLQASARDPLDLIAENAFMEIKHRVENTVYKQRARLSSAGASAILDDARQLASMGDYLQSDSPDVSLINDVERNAVLQDLRAATVVTYLREAWMGEVDQRLRVTFDSLCQSYAPEEFSQVESNCGTAIMDPNLIVMEVKFDRAIPCWIRDALIAQELRLRRFSKYASGVLTAHAPQGYPEWLRRIASGGENQSSQDSANSLTPNPQLASSLAAPLAIPSAPPVCSPGVLD